MKISFVYDSFGGVLGGAERFSAEFVRHLKSLGHEVVVHALGPETKAENGCAYGAALKVYFFKTLKRTGLLKDSQLFTLKLNEVWGRDFDEKLKIEKPDLVIGAGMLSIAAVKSARAKNIKSMIYVHGLEAFSPTFFLGETGRERVKFLTVPLRYKLKWPIVRRYMDAYREAYAMTDYLVANSFFVAELIRATGIRKDVEHFYPFFKNELSHLHVTSLYRSLEDRSILFYKPQTIKGAALFCKIAKALPHLNFLVLGRLPKVFQFRIRNLKNVRSVLRAEDMNQIWNQTSLVIGPSQFPEPFGRIFFEAGRQSIPSVAARIGGIPESTGSRAKFLDAFSDVDHWVQALNEIMEPDAYRRACRNARADAEILTSKNEASLIGFFKQVQQDVIDHQTVNSPDETVTEDRKPGTLIPSPISISVLPLS